MHLKEQKQTNNVSYILNHEYHEVSGSSNRADMNMGLLYLFYQIEVNTTVETSSV